MVYDKAVGAPVGVKIQKCRITSIGMDKPYTTFETPPKRTRSSVTIRFIVRVPIFSFIILLWIAENIPAAVPSDHLRLDIGPKTEILKDPQAELTLNRILQSPDTFDFIPNKSKTLPVVDYRTAYWIRFKLPRSAFESSETRFLEVGSYFSRLFDEIDLFIPKNGMKSDTDTKSRGTIAAPTTWMCGTAPAYSS